MILLEIDPDASDPNTSVVKTYLYAHAQILAQHDGHYAEPIYFYLHDRLGSVRQVIDTDGAVANTYTYEPFGAPFASEVAETVSNPWTFTGQWYDAEIAQYFLRARMYDPGIYRFTARDPDLGQWTEPLTLHRYLYCLNDPLNRTDPTGELALIIDVGIGSTTSSAMRAHDARIKVGAGTAIAVLIASQVDWYNLTVSLAAAGEESLQEIGWA